MRRSSAVQRVAVERPQERQRRGRDPEERMRRAVAAAAAGTASLSQYRLVYADRLAVYEEALFSFAPVVVACEQMGRETCAPVAALAYPPDVDLPEHVVLAFHAAHRRATGQDRHSYVVCRYQPEGRRDAALDLLALGEDQGLKFRRRIWCNDTNAGWTLRAEVLQAAAQDGCSIEAAQVAVSRFPFASPAVKR